MSPAPVTPFTLDGAVDFAAIQRLGSWLGSIDGVKSLVVLGHAGEGTFLTQDEQAQVIRAFIESTNGRIPVIAGITLEGTKVAAEEAKRAVAAGRRCRPRLPVARLAALRLPEGRAAGPLSRDLRGKRPAAHPLPVSGRDQGDLQPRDAARDRRAAGRVRDEERRAQHEALGHRDPVIRRERPDLQILTCHDEYLLHTMFDVDGALVGYGGIAPEPLIEMIAAGKAKDYAKARALHDRLLPVTSNVYHRGSHMEGSVALKWALVARGILDHATVRPPLLPLAEGAARRDRGRDEVRGSRPRQHIRNQESRLTARRRWSAAALRRRRRLEERS